MWEIIECSTKSPDPDLSTRPRVGMGTIILIMKDYKTWINEMIKEHWTENIGRFNEGGKGEIKTISLSSVSVDVFRLMQLLFLSCWNCRQKEIYMRSLSTKGIAPNMEWSWEDLRSAENIYSVTKYPNFHMWLNVTPRGPNLLLPSTWLCPSCVRSYMLYP